MNAAPDRHGPRVNTDIEADNIRLIDHDGSNVGVVTVKDGVSRAAEMGLDLVEISPGANPPVCKIMDFGKFKYQEQKKKNQAKKKQKVISIKEIKMRPGIDDHDYGIKMKAMSKFLEEGDKVKVTLRFRGREMAYQDRGMVVLRRIQEDLGELAKVEQMPKMEGRQMVMVVAPR